MWIETFTGVMINIDHSRFMHIQPKKEEDQWTVIITLDEDIRCGYAEGSWAECQAHMDTLGAALKVERHQKLTPFQMREPFIGEELDDI